MGFVAPIIQIALTVGSIIYQRQQQRKLKRAQEAAAERARDQAATRNVRQTGSSVPLEFLYGYVAVSPSIVNVNVSSGGGNVTMGANADSVHGNLGNFSPRNNELLVLQKAIGFGPLDAAVTVDVEGNNITDERFNDFSRVAVNNTGGEVDPVAVRLSSTVFDGTETSVPEAMRGPTEFNDIAYTTEFYRMNRDEPQFGGPPSSYIYFRGRRIRELTKDGDNPAVVSTTRSFSSNAVRVLLDYLLDDTVGAGLSPDDLDLESFYEAQQQSEIIVRTVQSVSRVHGGSMDSTVARPLLKHEFNGLISSQNDHISNIGTIVDAIPGAVFLRTATGKIKLSVPLVDNPTSASNMAISPNTNDNEAVSVYTLTEADLVDEPSITFPDTSERLNRVTVTFPNEEKNFAQDSFTYFDEDLFEADLEIPLDSNVNLPGISAHNHAEFLARTLVAESRLPSYQFRLTSEGFLLEPGDVIRLNIRPNARNPEGTDIGAGTFTRNSSGSDGLYVRIGQMTIMQDLTIMVTATEFNFQTYTWDANDDETIQQVPEFNFTVMPPHAVRARFDAPNRQIVVEWDPAQDAMGNDIETALVNRYEIEFRALTETQMESDLAGDPAADLDTQEYAMLLYSDLEDQRIEDNEANAEILDTDALRNYRWIPLATVPRTPRRYNHVIVNTDEELFYQYRIKAVTVDNRRSTATFDVPLPPMT